MGFGRLSFTTETASARIIDGRPYSMLENNMSLHCQRLHSKICIGFIHRDCCSVPVLESSVMGGPEKTRSRGQWSHIVS